MSSTRTIAPQVLAGSRSASSRMARVWRGLWSQNHRRGGVAQLHAAPRQVAAEGSGEPAAMVALYISAESPTDTAPSSRARARPSGPQQET